jgi:hypothetical protein
MSLNVIPKTMKARHFETGEWQVLHCDTDALYTWCVRPWRCYVDDGPDGGFGVDLADFDMFEGVVS